MPKIPSLLVNFLESKYSNSVEVVEIKDLTLQLRRVRFYGDALKGCPFRPGQVVEFRVNTQTFRHYTPSSFDSQLGFMELLFYLHGKGPGSTWASQLKVGDHIKILGPGGRFYFQSKAKTHVFLGDETTLGLFSCLQNAAPIGSIQGMIEVNLGNAVWVEHLGLQLSVNERYQTSRGVHLLGWIQQHADSLGRDAHFYVAGHAQSTASVRSLLKELGYSRKQVSCQNYWDERKKGL